MNGNCRGKFDRRPVGRGVKGGDASCKRRKKIVPSILIKFVMHNSLPFFFILDLFPFSVLFE